jgi:hypothetical protein
MRVQTVIGALIAGRLAPPILVASAVEVEVIKVGGDDVGGVWWIEQEGVLNFICITFTCQSSASNWSARVQ